MIMIYHHGLIAQPILVPFRRLLANSIFVTNQAPSRNQVMDVLTLQIYPDAHQFQSTAMTYMDQETAIVATQFPRMQLQRRLVTMAGLTVLFCLCWCFPQSDSWRPGSQNVRSQKRLPSKHTAPG